MGRNLVKKTFTANGTFTAPAGVTNVRLAIQKAVSPYNTQNSAGALVQAGVVDAFGKLYVWGGNLNGQIGVADVVPRSSPTLVLGGTTVRKFVGYNTNGFGATYALDTQGRIFACGGLNQAGQLGNGGFTALSNPTAVLGSLSFQDLVLREDGLSVCALGTGGKAFAWGNNANGELGVGDVLARSSPIAVLGGLTFASIWKGGSGFFGLTSAGTAYAWGSNLQGELGVGDVLPRSSPVAVLGGLTFKKILSVGTSGAYGTMGITTSGVLYAWGLNPVGRLGLNDLIPRSSPVAVVGLSGVTIVDVVTCNGGAVLALSSTGQAYAIGGANSSGELGLGDTVARSSPVAVLGGINFAKLFGGPNTCFFGVDTSGNLYAWGFNIFGQLGVGDTLARSSPVAVLGGLSWYSVGNADVGATSAGVIGITNQGALYGWGVNTDGQLGVGDVAPRSSPVAVVGNVVAGIQPNVKHVDIAVTPGSTYAVTIQQFQIMFGSQMVDTGQVSSLTIFYER